MIWWWAGICVCLFCKEVQLITLRREAMETEKKSTYNYYYMDGLHFVDVYDSSRIIVSSGISSISKSDALFGAFDKLEDCGKGYTYKNIQLKSEVK